jgi:hypothetical protein
MKTGDIALFIGAMALAPGLAHAQDINATPNYGSVTLATGFNPDPHTINVVAGGNIQASTLGGSCTGTISSSPDYRVTYTAGTTFPLIIRTSSGSDTTLVVNGADGSWYCDDDSAGSSNAQVRFNSPRSGVYDIWVGSYSSGTTPTATLMITELANDTPAPAPQPAPVPAPQPAPQPMPPAPQPDASMKATYGEITLSSGFTPDPRRIPLRAGGNIDVSGLGDQCQGSVARAPDFRIEYHAGRQPLIIRTDSTSDTTLVVNDPDGMWQCNDDGAGTDSAGNSSNAELLFDKPPSGTYEIWVGTYGGGTAAATLIVTERP